MTSKARLSILVQLLVFFTLLAAAGPVFGGVITPESGGSANADATASLYKLVLYVALVVFVAVEGALFFALFKFKRRRRDQQAVQIVGNTSLELGWTAGAALILVILAVATFVKLDDIKDPPGGKIPEPQQISPAGAAQSQATAQNSTPSGNKINIDVSGQQFLWRYTYPNNTFSYYELVVPEDTVIILNITSTDVAHSWYVPKLGGKRDALPGYRQSTWFKADGPGVYEGQCAELCGEHHANMRARVRVVTKAKYEAWLQQNQNDIKEAQADLKRLKAIFGEQALRSSGKQGYGNS